MLSTCLKFFSTIITLCILASCGESTPGDKEDKLSSADTTAVAADEYYSADDFAKVEKFDSHVHINTSDTLLTSLARENNFRLLSINVAAPGYPSLPQQQAFSVQHVRNFPNRLSFATSFDMDGFDKPNWQAKAIAYLDSSFRNGAVAVKVWKNIGMELKDKNGKFIMIDRPRFDTVFDFIQSQNKTLIGHLGEPKNCWLPLDQMTVKNDSNYFSKNPRYHMYLHPEFPSYEEQLNARDNVLRKHPELRFVGAHLGSLEWSVDALAARLDSFPNMRVDMAARMSHLQHQAKSDRKKVIDFFEKYQDRLVYATDLVYDDKSNKEEFAKRCRETWMNHWKFLTSDEMMEAGEVTGSFQALHLPRRIVNKIYHDNAGKSIRGIYDNK